MANIVEFKEISLRDLTIGLGQVRSRDVAKDIQELADSIEHVGLLEPIIVCQTEEPGQYEIITGQRRFLAHQQLNKDTIWAAVLNERISDREAKVLSITENLVRRDLNSRDLIDACTDLYHRYGTVRAVADETGLPYAKVSEYVKYDQLDPKLKELVDKKQVSLTAALRAQAAASVQDGLNVEEACQFAIEMNPMSGVQQKKIVTTRSKNPSLEAGAVIEDAKSAGKVVQIVITLTSDIHSALSDFAQSQQTNTDEAASQLIADGLYVNDFTDNRLA